MEILKKILSHFVFLTLLLICSCVDPLDIDLEEQESKLIVFGEINNLEEEYTIYLSRSSDYSKTFNPFEEGANVRVIDESGNAYNFSEREPGVYKSCKSEFKGEIGKEYRIEIITADDKVYTSEMQNMTSPGTVDSVYYEETRELKEAVNGELYEESGLLFFCDYTDSPDKDYIKIDWEGIFKFKSSSYDRQHEYCWKSEKTEFQIDIHDDIYTNNSTIYQHEVKFLPNGFRFQEGYSFQVRLKSIGEGAYKFWELVKQQTESDGSIFSALPAQIKSNIFNVDDPEEEVLGYFFVSGISAKRARVSEFYSQSVRDVPLPQCMPFGPGNWLPDHCYDCSTYLNSTAEEPSFW